MKIIEEETTKFMTKYSKTTPTFSGGFNKIFSIYFWEP